MVAKGRVIRPLQSRFNSDFVVHSEPEFLFTAEVALCYLYGNLAEQELNLVEFAAGEVAKPRICSSEIMRRQLVYAGSLGRSLDNLPKRLRSHSLAPDLPRVVIALKRQPSLIPLASVQRSSACFTQGGIGTVRMRPAFP